MKKSILITATLAALAMLASCQKEQFTKNVTSATGVTEFTATIEQPTKTAISDEGKVTWVAGDTIIVTDAAQKSAVYVASSAGASTTFTLKEGQEAVGDGPYTATYGDINNQKYDTAGANCPLTAAETSTTTFKFSSPYAVVKITAQSDGEEGETIRSVDVNYGENTYTLDCVTGVTLTSAGIDFFVSVESATTAALSVTFHTTDGKTATKERKEAATLAAKDLLPVTLTFAAGDWESPESDIPDGALKGVFSVSADKQVYFSQGNLVATINATGTPTDWKFATNQYDYIGGTVANTSIGNTSTSGTAGDVDLFGWSTSTNGGTSTTDNYGIKTSTSTSDYSGEFYDWGKAYCEENSITPDNTWRTLSTEEWQYLFNFGSYTSEVRNGKYKYGVTVCGKANCVVLLPDGWKWEGDVGTEWQTEYPEKQTNNEVTWQKMEDAGAVCLPAAGYRYGSDVGIVGDFGFYWSSTAYDSDDAYSVSFCSSDVYLDIKDTRDSGYSVRLVTNVSAAPAPTAPAYVEITAKYDGEDQPERTLKWYRQNLAITDSGNKPWKGDNTSGAVKVPGTNEDVVVGDYFQWGAYAGYCGDATADDKGLLIYNSFTNTKCFGITGSDGFDFKSAGDGKTYQFAIDSDETSVGISPHYDNSEGKYTKYTDEDDKTILDTTSTDNDDVAHIILGDNWRMPTFDEFDALKKATYWAWDGTDCGYYVFAPDASHTAGTNVSSIPGGLEKADALLFFPAAAFGYGTDLYAGNFGYYWSGSLGSSATDYAYGLRFYSDDYYPQFNYYDRYSGLSVRPVSE